MNTITTNPFDLIAFAMIPIIVHGVEPSDCMEIFSDKESFVAIAAIKSK